LFEEESFTRRRELVDLVRSWMRATPVNGLVGGLMAMRDRKDYTSLLPELTTPSGVIVAELDKAVKLELAKEFERLPQHKFVVLKGAGHMVNMERPEVLNRALVEFLKI
jgi:pimeloyl-ACP methyl ester carboxylesterase